MNSSHLLALTFTAFPWSCIIKHIFVSVVDHTIAAEVNHLHTRDLTYSKELLRVLAAQEASVFNVFLVELVALLVHVYALHTCLP